MKGFVVVGDVHGDTFKYNKFLKIINNNEFVLQIGDFGSDFSYFDECDPDHIKLLGGNHDNYEIVPKLPHYLGDYGTHVLNGQSFFFLRGAESPDRKIRTIGVDYWPEEELTYRELEEAFEAYKEAKPNVMITHDAPSRIAEIIGDPQFLVDWGFSAYHHSRTQMMLDQMFEFHQPKIWVFGHFHKSRRLEIQGCKFIGLNINEHYFLNEGVNV